jgi:hypothetical protein
MPGVFGRRGTVADHARQQSCIVKVELAGGEPKSGRQDSNLRPLRPERSALAKLSYSPNNYDPKYTITASELQPPFLFTKQSLLSGCISILNTSQTFLFLRTPRALKVHLSLCSGRPVRVRFVVKQSPRCVLSGVFSTSPGIMFFEPASEVIGMPDIESACLQALKDIDVIHNFATLKSPQLLEIHPLFIPPRVVAKIAYHAGKVNQDWSQGRKSRSLWTLSHP